MFPIGDDNTGRRIFPVVTYALIVLNVLFFFVELSGGEQFIQQWSVVPRRLVANPAADFPTIFTSMFMHAGWLHLFGNMLYLWIFGDNVEDSFGHFKFLIFYLLCGIAAIFAAVYGTAAVVARRQLRLDATLFHLRDVVVVQLPGGILAPAQRRLHRGARAGSGLQ